MEIQKYGELSKTDIANLSQAGIIPNGTPPAQVRIFAEVCKQKGISPFQKHIYLIKYGNTYQSIMGIDGFRFIASGTGAHAGTDQVTYNDGMSLDECIKAGISAPRSATCTVHKIVAGLRVPFTHSVSFREFSGSGKWKQMPYQMLAKVAEAHALKKAFPEMLSGLYVPEEKAAFMNENSPIQEVKVEKISKEDSQKELDKMIEVIKASYTEYQLLRNDARGIVTDAASGGMHEVHIEELKGFINETCLKLKG